MSVGEQSHTEPFLKAVWTHVALPCVISIHYQGWGVQEMVGGRGQGQLGSAAMEVGIHTTRL